MTWVRDGLLEAGSAVSGYDGPLLSMVRVGFLCPWLLWISCTLVYCRPPGRLTGCSVWASFGLIWPRLGSWSEGMWSSGRSQGVGPHQLGIVGVPAGMGIWVRFSFVSLVTMDLLGGTQAVGLGWYLAS